MKRNLYNRPRLHRGMYLNIDILKHNPRECNTHSRIHIHTPTQYSYVSLSLHQTERTTISTTTGNSMFRKQQVS